MAKLFRQALKAGLQLPESKRPEEADRTNDPNDCPYHRVVSNPIEDCYVFKDWLERKYRNGEFTLSNSVLVHPKKESAKVVTSSSIPPAPTQKEKPTRDEEWETAVSKKTKKMLKELEGVPGVQWRSPTEPLFKLEERQRPNTSIFKPPPSKVRLKGAS